jgi:hypothetical protein
MLCTHWLRAWRGSVEDVLSTGTPTCDDEKVLESAATAWITSGSSSSVKKDSMPIAAKALSQQLSKEE